MKASCFSDDGINCVVFAATEEEIENKEITGEFLTNEDYDLIGKISVDLEIEEIQTEDYLLESDKTIEEIRNILSKYNIEIDERINDCSWG